MQGLGILPTILIVCYSAYLLAAAVGMGAIVWLVSKDIARRDSPDTPSD